MKNKTQRLLTIRRIIREDKISNQEELLERLEKAGFRLTQATLSRDLKFLKVGKIPDNKKGYVYVLPETEIQQANRLSDDNFPVNGFISLDFSYHLGVLKTLPGYANSIASAIDNLDTYEVLGTVAGDDTILIIPREGVAQNDIRNVIARLVPDLIIQ